MAIKVFISQPMRDKTEEQILSERNRAIKNIKEKYPNEDVEIIDSYFEDYDPQDGCIPLKYLAKSIELLADADVAYFVDGWDEARGCLTEYQCATQYDIPVICEYFPESTIEIKYFSDDITKIENIEQGDWIDLRAAEDVDLNANEFALIPLGVGMKLPKGYEAHIVPRSSTFKNFGIIQTNHMGVIDESYCGEEDQWKFPAYALRDTMIRKNDRICQFRIVKKQEEIFFKEVDALNPVSRGGFGSTGVK